MKVLSQFLLIMIVSYGYARGQCLIQGEACSCIQLVKSFELRCLKTVSAPSLFPSLEIQQQLNKSRTGSKKIVRISYKHYSELPARALSCLNASEVYLQQDGISSIHTEAFRDAHVDKLALNKNFLNTTNFLQFLPDLSLLILKLNKYNAIYNQTFAHQKHLKELYLSDNMISKLDLNAFEGLIVLRILQISHNRLSRLVPFLFAGLSNLEILRLHENQITAVRAHDFTGLTSVRFVNLDQNEIDSIEDFSFADCASMTSLILDKNRLTAIGHGTFAGLINLVKLYLTMNKISVIEAGSFKTNSKLTLIDLYGNMIRHIYEGSFLGLTDLVENLLLGGQNLEYIESGTFQGLTNLRVLSLKASNIKNMSSRAFEGLESLDSLYLHFNDFDTIMTETFFGLKNMKELNLDSMNIALLEERSFNGLDNLVSLNLYYNYIVSLPSNSFLGLGSLELLNLSYNLLNIVEQDCFCGLKNVRTIDLSNNELENLTSYCLNSTGRLERLWLDWNLIANLSDCAFCGVEKSLVCLNLSSNKLDFIKKCYFKRLEALQVLDLSRNDMLNIEMGSFDDLTSLIYLDLSVNCLFRIQEDLLLYVSNLQVLNISMNMINLPSFEPLKSQNQLSTLQASYNLIEHFDDVENETLPSLSSIDLSHNPLLKTFSLSPNYIAVYLNGNQRVSLTVRGAQNTNLKRLEANNVSLGSLVNSNASSILARLEELDLGSNDLTTVPGRFGYLNKNLFTLRLQDSTLNSDLSFLDRFTDLIELDLSFCKRVIFGNEPVLARNLKLETLRMAGLNLTSQFMDDYLILPKYKNLVNLDLSHNSIEYFTAHLELNNLVSITLSSNLIKEFNFGRRDFDLVDLGFNQLNGLSLTNYDLFKSANLVLRNNQMSSIDLICMTLFQKTETLDLSQNNLTELNRLRDEEIYFPSETRHFNLSNNCLWSVGDLFAPLSWSPTMPLETADLSSNCFESINFSLKALKNLQRLILSGNKISALDDASFTGLKRLATLDLSSNRIARIGENSFTGLIYLFFLNLSSNVLTEVNELQFSGLKSLRVLDLSNNSISYFHPKTFSKLLNLKDLYIQMNQIRAIDKLDGFSSIRNINLDLNVIAQNFTNVLSLERSIRVQFYKESLGISYLKSVNVITYPKNANQVDMNDYCSATMFLIKHSVSLNLKNGDDFDAFFIDCEEFSTNFMFNSG